MKAWSKEEDALLREVFEKGERIADIVSLFPGRTFFAVKVHASRIGLAHKSFREWTPAEDAILREIWSAPRNIKTGLHRLPGRSYDAAKIRATRLGLGIKTAAQSGTRSWVLRAVMKLLSNGAVITTKEIAAITGIDRGSVQDTLAKWHGIEFRVGAWERVDRNHLAMKWALGAGEDAPKPSPKTKEECWKAYRERQRISKGIFNPFAAAAGLVSAPEAGQGRVYQQSMNLRDFEEAA
jgi:hypothetical protein